MSILPAASYISGPLYQRLITTASTLILDYSDHCPGCTLQTAFASEATLDYIIRSIFVVWWDKKFDHRHEANVLVNKFIEVREDCLGNLNMQVSLDFLIQFNLYFPAMTRTHPTQQPATTTTCTSTTTARTGTPTCPRSTGATARGQTPSDCPS